MRNYKYYGLQNLRVKYFYVLHGNVVGELFYHPRHAKEEEKGEEDIKLRSISAPSYQKVQSGLLQWLLEEVTHPYNDLHRGIYWNNEGEFHCMKHCTNKTLHQDIKDIMTEIWEDVH